MHRRAFLRATATLAPLIGVASAVAPAWPDTLTPIRLTSTAGDDLRPVLYAQSTGLFTRAGLDLSLQIAGSGSIAAQAVVAGSMDIAKASITALIEAYARGIAVELVAPSMIYRKDALSSCIIVAPKSPLRTARDLAGKVIATSGLGAVGDLGLRALVDAQGGDSSTIHWIEMPASSVNLAVAQGRADAGIAQDPFMTEDIAAGKVRFLLDMLSGYPRPILVSVFFAMRSYAAKNGDVLGRFSGVVRDAARYTDAHQAQTVPLFVAISGMDPKVAMQMHHSYTPLSFDPSQIQPVIDLAARYAVIPKAFDARELLSR